MTDITLVATLPAALFCFCLWISRPTALPSGVLGASVALAILSKFTAIAFLAVCGFPILLCCFFSLPPGRKLMDFRTILLAALVTAILIWVGYRFSFDPAIRGLHQLSIHNDEGHPNYFLGERRMTGWWSFYPVLLSVKTPVGFLILTAIGILSLAADSAQRMRWQAWTPVLSVAGMLAVGFMSNINTGLRHILPIYAMLAGMAAFGAVKLWNSSLAWRCVSGALLLWSTASSLAAHPDYLAYFNELAIGEAGRFGVDSDLDYGQDLWRLRDACVRHQVDSIWIAYNGSADLDLFSLPKRRPLPPYAPQTGWVAISLFKLKLGESTEGFLDDPATFAWLEKYTPVALVGKSMRLYYIPPD